MANWDLFREMDNLRREIDDAFRGFGGRGLRGARLLPAAGLRRQVRLNLYGDADKLYVEALVPGVAPEKLDVTVEGNVLTIAGVRQAVEEQGQTWHRRERETGRFMRTLELPVEVDADQVKASYRDGVLTVTLPKSMAARPKRISIQAE